MLKIKDLLKFLLGHTCSSFGRTPELRVDRDFIQAADASQRVGRSVGVGRPPRGDTQGSARPAHHEIAGTTAVLPPNQKHAEINMMCASCIMPHRRPAPIHHHGISTCTRSDETVSNINTQPPDTRQRSFTLHFEAAGPKLTTAVIFHSEYGIHR